MITTIAHFLSACSFFIALLHLLVWKAKMTIWIPVAACAVLVIILVLWCITNSWDSSEEKLEEVPS
jgi:membrane-bound acyltransferase YfiQ involved in biofilm formation